MRLLPDSPRYRLAVVVPLAAVVAFGLFLVTALLVQQRAPSAAPPVPQKVTLLQHVPLRAVAGGKAGSHKAARGMARIGARGSLLRAPPPMLSPSLLLPASGVSNVESRVPMRFSDPNKLDKLVATATVGFLGLRGRGHGHRKWVGAGSGLFYLPDSGIRVHQLRYTCNHVPLSRKSREMTAFVSALVTSNGRVKDVNVTSAAMIQGTSEDSLRKAMEGGWRFEPLVINGKATAFRLRFVTTVEASMEGVIAVHCWWGNFNEVHRGTLTPTWIVYLPKQGLPIAYAYIAPQHLGEAPGGLAPADDERGGNP